MKVYFFGVIFFLSCVVFVLRCIVIDNLDKFELEVILIVRNNFYVDDLLKFVLIEEGVIKFVIDL